MACVVRFDRALEAEGEFMSIGTRVAGHLPYLRRYARALTGSQTAGDAFVRATLEAALADESLRNTIGQSRVALYHAFSQLWESAQVDTRDNSGQNRGAAGELEVAAQERLARITPRNRQALLLTTLEDFSIEDTATIIGATPAEVETLVHQAIAEIDDDSATRVLIIEDEPLISMQLEDIVRALGHDICGTAATRTQAREIITRETPGLVLADIQLADGSSGLDAVDDILAIDDVPVIFITAYPERLLTGDRPEPTYLITKPFHEATVRAAISQALFFGSSRPLG